MFERFKKGKNKQSHPESLLAADWWASRLCDDKVRFYNGNLCLIKYKTNVPERQQVALFEEKIKRIVDSYLDNSDGVFDLKLSSSDKRLIDLAHEVDIDDFESHFGKGAVMFISAYDGITVSYKGQERSRKL